MSSKIEDSPPKRTTRTRNLLRLVSAYFALILIFSGSFLAMRHHFAQHMINEAAPTGDTTSFSPVIPTEEGQLLKLNRQFISGMIVFTCGFLALGRFYWKGEKSSFVAVTVVVATGLLAELSIRAYADVDISADSWGYHLPFAARLLGIVGRDLYQFNNNTEPQYSGFPHLFEFIQGFLWKVTDRVQAANFVCLLSLVSFCFIMKRVVGVRWQYVLLALITVPMVQIHATSDYVDLPVNLCVSTLIIIVYKWFIEGKKVDNCEFVVSSLAAICAANGKLVMVPISFILFGMIFWARFGEDLRLRKILTSPGRSATRLLLGAACIIVTGLTTLKDAIAYGNPFFPLKITLFGLTSPSGSNSDPAYRLIASAHGFDVIGNATRWVSSILELRDKPFSWSIDQWNSQADIRSMGGYFGAFMVANLLLVVAKLIFKPSNRPWRERLFWFLLISLTAIAPRSLELRFYMYFPIVLVTLNLYWISGMKRPEEAVSRAEKMWMSAVLAFLIIVLAGTRLTHVRPHFYGMPQLLADQVDPRALAQVKAGGSYTIDNAWWPFLYCAKFHQKGIYALHDIRGAQGHPAGPVEIKAVGSIDHGGDTQ